MSSIGKTEAAWIQLFEKYNILEAISQKGIYKISANEIKEFREPRLMAKFDHSINLPSLFSENNLSILPITRGDYVIGSFDTYHAFEETPTDVVKFSLPEYIESLDHKNVPSETIALNCAVASGIAEDFLEDENIVATVSGRMGSGEFNFNIGNTAGEGSYNISVRNSQIEIDAAYEGQYYLSLFEAKRDLSDDFLVRQLYYPYRVWSERVQKPVKPIYLVYSNGIYRMYEYSFIEPDNYSSIKLVKQKNYVLDVIDITIDDIICILETVPIAPEPEIPFPQADKFERVINLCELLKEGPLSRSEVTENYAFDGRQTNYYTAAAKYLGLLDAVHGQGYTLSSEGARIMSLGLKQRQIELIKRILSHEVFNASMREYFDKGCMLTTEEIVEVMKSTYLYNINTDSTYKRRASTVKGWLSWILSLVS